MITNKSPLTGAFVVSGSYTKKGIKSFAEGNPRQNKGCLGGGFWAGAGVEFGARI